MNSSQATLIRLVAITRAQVSGERRRSRQLRLTVNRRRLANDQF